MHVEFSSVCDLESWMKLVTAVRWNFPGLETPEALEDHRQTVLRFMGEYRALCVKDGSKVIGVLLLSKKHNMICCLAVDPAYRRNGIASALLKKALYELNRAEDITVTTFRENDVKGIAPRALYKSFGFLEGELFVEFGYPVQKFVLKGSSATRVSLQPMTREMCHAFYKGFQNDPAIGHYYEYVYSPEIADRYFDSNSVSDRKLFAIMVEGQIIGECKLKNIDLSKRECTMGIHLQNDTVKGKGYGTQAERLILEYAFEQMGMAAVCADAALKNTRSQHILKKVGFQYICEDETFRYYRCEQDQYWQKFRTKK